MIPILFNNSIIYIMITQREEGLSLAIIALQKIFLTKKMIFNNNQSFEKNLL